MKLILLSLVISFFTVSAYSAEVEVIQGEEVVLLKTATVEEIDRILKLEVSRDERKPLLIEAMQAELVATEGEESFCEVAGRIYSDQNRSPELVQDRCAQVLVTRDFIDDLASGGLEDASDLSEVRRLLSQFLKLLILF